NATLRPRIRLLGSQLSCGWTYMRFAARILGCVVGSLALPLAGTVGFGRAGAIVGSMLGVASLMWGWVWLPRSRHDGFESGKYARAQRRYRMLGMLAGSAARERSALLSRAGCCIAAGQVERAAHLLAAIDVGTLAVAERAVWLNNRACAQLAAGGDP